MTARAMCDDLETRGVIGRYVAGKASEDEAAELEAHFLTCAWCQEEVRLAAAIAAAPQTKAVPHRPGHWLPIGAALAAVIAGVVIFAPRGPSADAAQLGAVLQPPLYLGIPVRGVPATADSQFARAMAEYVGGNHAAAAEGLAAALAMGVDSAAAGFFRAASLLMIEQNDSAAAGFARVVALGPSPYLGEAHYYRAKALLRLGRTADAVAELRAVDVEGDAGRASAALADSIEALAR